jgi:hypothetical protein
LPQSKFCINFDNNGLGYILGDFFTNQPGLPDPDSVFFGLFVPFANSCEQGDPIWRIFAHCVIVYFEQFF